MKKASLSGSLRENVGKKDAKSLRREGRVPAVLYGGDKQIQFSLKDIEIEKLVFNADTFRIELDLDGKVYSTIIQDLQFHPVTDKVVHVDFLELFEDKKAKVSLPVRTTGNSVGVRNGGRLAINFRSVPVKGLPGDIPEEILVDITELEIGGVKRVNEVTIEGCELLLNESSVLVAVKRTRAAMAADAASEEEGVAEGEEASEEAAAE